MILLDIYPYLLKQDLISIQDVLLLKSFLIFLWLFLTNSCLNYASTYIYTSFIRSNYC